MNYIIMPFITPSTLYLLIILILLLSLSLSFYFLWRMTRSRAPEHLTEKEHQKTLKETLSKQKQIQAIHINQTVQSLWTAFKLITQKRCRTVRKLPCYLALSPHHASLETFLAQCELRFAAYPHAYAENTLENIQSFLSQWHISDEMIILSPFAKSQENFNVTAQSTEWQSTLKLLKKFRRFKPLNGILITLNLSDFILQSTSTAAETLKQLAQCLDNLYQQFHTAIPLYFIFTQSNSIAGFHDFFADLSPVAQQQPWGFSLPAENIPKASQEATQRVKNFDQAFEAWIHALTQRILPRLAQEKDSQRRGIIAYFPQQMRLCKPALKQLILHLNTFYLRGFYFTGTTHTEKMHDFVMSLLDVRYGLPSQLSSSFTQHHTHPYFSKNLFSAVILKDNAGLQKNSYGYLWKNLSTRCRFLIATGLLSIGGAGFSISYVHNTASLEGISTDISLYRDTYKQLTPHHMTLASPLESLNTLTKIRAYFIHSSSPLSVYFLGYTPLYIRHQLSQIWQQALITQFMPRVCFQLGILLETNLSHPDILYDALKGYLVFSPAAQSHPQWIKPPIQHYLVQTYPESNAIPQQINRLLESALTYPVNHLPLNEPLIEKIRQQLRKIPPALLAYHELKTQAQTSQQQFSITQKISTDFNAVFTYQDTDSAPLPLLFTLQGFRKLQDRGTQTLILHTAEVYQILGLTSQQNNSSILVADMTAQVWERYNQEYIAAWNHYLSRINIVPFNNLTQAIQLLTLLTHAHNPLHQTLQAVMENTATLQTSAMTVADHFKPLNTFTGLPGKPSAQYTSLMKNLTMLRDYLSNLAAAPNTAQSEFQEATAYLQHTSPNHPIALLKRQAQQLPVPVNQWVNSIADNSFALLLAGAHQVINKAWQNKVYPAYENTIADKFPFSKQTETVVSLTSFGDFFGNGGIFHQFFEVYLAPFLDTSHSPWSQYQSGEYKIGFSTETLAQFERADKIRTLYFPHHDKIPYVSFFIQPQILDRLSSGIYLQLANQTLTYRHGPQQIFNWHWPALEDTQQVSISFNDFSGKTTSLTQEGLWAWFALLNGTTLQPTEMPGHYRWTITQDNHHASFTLWASNNLSVFNLALFQNFNLPSEI